MSAKHPHNAAPPWRKRRRAPARRAAADAPSSVDEVAGALTPGARQPGDAAVAAAALAPSGLPAAATVPAWLAGRAGDVAFRMRRWRDHLGRGERAPAAGAALAVADPALAVADPAPAVAGPAAVLDPARDPVAVMDPDARVGVMDAPMATPADAALIEVADEMRPDAGPSDLGPPAPAPAASPTTVAPGRVAATAILVAPAPSSDKPRVSVVVHDPAVERIRSTAAQRLGDDGERLAAMRLEALGWRIVARNIRLNRAEVDVLAIDPADPPSLVLVEVRLRSRRDFGLAEETVDHRKRAALRRAAGELAARPVLPDGRRLPALPVRIDLIAIDRGPDGRPSLRHHRGIET